MDLLSSSLLPRKRAARVASLYLSSEPSSSYIISRAVEVSRTLSSSSNRPVRENESARRAIANSTASRLWLQVCQPHINSLNVSMSWSDSRCLAPRRLPAVDCLAIMISMLCISLLIRMYCNGAVSGLPVAMLSRSMMFSWLTEKGYSGSTIGSLFLGSGPTIGSLFLGSGPTAPRKLPHEYHSGCCLGTAQRP